MDLREYLKVKRGPWIGTFDSLHADRHAAVNERCCLQGTCIELGRVVGVYVASSILLLVFWVREYSERRIASQAMHEVSLRLVREFRRFYRSRRRRRVGSSMSEASRDLCHTVTLRVVSPQVAALAP